MYRFPGYQQLLTCFLVILAVLVEKGRTFSYSHTIRSNPLSPPNLFSRSLVEGMSRRYNGGNTALSASQSSNGRSWNKGINQSTSADDLTIMSSSRVDMQDTTPSFPQSPPSTPLEISSSSPPTRKFFQKGVRSFSLNGILDHPDLNMGRFLVLLASAIYGTNFAVVKLLDDTMPLSISATLRFGLAAAVVSTIVLSRESDDVEPKVHKERNMAFWGGVEIGLWYCIGYIAQAEGLQTVAAGKSAFFNALAVVVVPILDVLFKSKILSKIEIASVLMACVGVGLLELGPEGGLTISSGDVLAFMQTIFFGMGYWRLESESHQHSHNAGRLTVGQLSAVAFGSMVYALTEMGFGHLDISLADKLMEWLGDPFIVGALMWTGLISTALALVSLLGIETMQLQITDAAHVFYFRCVGSYSISRRLLSRLCLQPNLHCS